MADTLTAADDSEFRAALQGLVHELYFKCKHFPGLHRFYSRAMHDVALSRCVDADWEVFNSTDDPFTALLTGAAASVRPAPDKPTRKALIDRWQRAESTINGRLRGILALLKPAERAALLGGLSPALSDLPALGLAFRGNPLGGKRADGRFGQPDLVLMADSVLVSGEK